MFRQSQVLSLKHMYTHMTNVKWTQLNLCIYVCICVFVEMYILYMYNVRIYIFVCISVDVCVCVEHPCPTISHLPCHGITLIAAFFGCLPELEDKALLLMPPKIKINRVGEIELQLTWMLPTCGLALIVSKKA